MNSKKISMTDYIQKDFCERFLWKISKCVQKDFFKKISTTDFYDGFLWKFLKIVKKISMKNYIQKNFFEKFLNVFI